MIAERIDKVCCSKGYNGSLSTLNKIIAKERRQEALDDNAYRRSVIFIVDC